MSIPNLTYQAFFTPEVTQVKYRSGEYTVIVSMVPGLGGLNEIVALVSIDHLYLGAIYLDLEGNRIYIRPSNQQPLEFVADPVPVSVEDKNLVITNCVDRLVTAQLKYYLRKLRETEALIRLLDPMYA